jgi:hypothetical protein
VNASTAGSSGQIVVAGAGYAGLHVGLRLTAKLRNNPVVELTLADRHDYHQALTELPRVAGGTRAADAVRIPFQDMLATRVRRKTQCDWPGRPGSASTCRARRIHPGSGREAQRRRGCAPGRPRPPRPEHPQRPRQRLTAQLPGTGTSASTERTHHDDASGPGHRPLTR